MTTTFVELLGVQLDLPLQLISELLVSRQLRLQLDVFVVHPGHLLGIVVQIAGHVEAVGVSRGFVAKLLVLLFAQVFQLAFQHSGVFF